MAHLVDALPRSEDCVRPLKQGEACRARPLEPQRQALCARPSQPAISNRSPSSVADIYLSIQSVRIQLLPRSKVLRREPSAATMSATSALRADTPTISAVVGDWIRCHRVPSVVSKIVPLRPTAQHSVFDVAWPASKSDRTPLSCFCQLLRSVERKIVPEFSSAQYTEWSGDETSTARTATAPAGAGSCEVLAAKAGLAGEGLLAGALCSAAPTGDVTLVGFEDVICACAEGLGKPAADPRAGAATVVAV